jgi:hypothetical protein
MGLKSDIMLAKKEAMKLHGLLSDEEIEELFVEGEANETEARLITKAIVDFLTHDDLHFTVSKLKASVELEEFNVSEDMDADVKKEKVVKDKISEVSAAKKGADFVVGMIESVKDIIPGVSSFITAYKTFWKITEKAVVKGIPKSEGKDDINIPAFDFRKDGGKHGGELDGRGHAYVGVEDPVKNSDTMDPESDDNSVELYRNKIPDELLE